MQKLKEGNGMAITFSTAAMMAEDNDDRIEEAQQNERLENARRMLDEVQEADGKCWALDSESKLYIIPNKGTLYTVWARTQGYKAFEERGLSYDDCISFMLDNDLIVED